MASVRSKALYRDLEAIFDGFSTSALGDGPLLDRFLTGKGVVKERAFETLVSRHGPMVFQVCHQRLGDRHEAEDACQAVFLVLARRARSVRNRESLGGWLYGVAVRVAARARKDADRRRDRERRAAVAAVRWREAVDQRSEIPCEAVHQSLARLPEKYRSPIVLCHLEGLTHEQAAVRLNWPVGTVRSRLARGRDRLRRLLVRQGVTSPSALGVLAFDAAVTSPSALPVSLAAETVRAACALIASPLLVASLSPAPLALMQGALAAMRIKKLALLATAVAPIGAIALAAGFALAQGSNPAEAPAQAQAPFEAARQVEVARKRDQRVDTLVNLAQIRLKILTEQFFKGTTEFEKVIGALDRLEEAEWIAVAGDAAKPAETKSRRIDFLKSLEEHAKTRLRTHQGSAAELLGIRQFRLMAELAPDQPEATAPTPRERLFEQRVKALESRLDAVVKQLDGLSR